ncbi:ribosome biogenesis GTP-binding protein YihA/YsxC [Paludicola sp. MB14-C6]|uniref:ribosome biogenesis GTP-binding protein YihA/YsxC n=1 Tax=Paludihabitans sp. MB14-C6 TaxID=3070656 RepID=UPI0027DD7B86|nr:ribosome biogenesis GTP-binding protein YihA/YsxC [Paludicola sp. MB14-C6]WMJ23584.1 ribosome biogenesis GTP-binding protein YihA/YsxC [Paludicola sp. MB14-C6]
MNFNKAKFVISYGLSKQIPESETIEIAFAGRSNVGKSSAINKIFNRKNLARVSCVPGKTATINFYSVGDEVNFVDLPGYGYAKVSKSEKYRWSELIEGYFNQDRNIGLVIQLVDMRHPATALDIHMMEYMIEREIPFIVVLTKSDKLNKTQTQNRLDLIRSEIPYGDQITIIPFSSETGEGVEQVKRIIEEVVDESKEIDVELDDEIEEELLEDNQED